MVGRRTQRRARQRGGGDGAYGFNGVDSISAAGTPLDTRGASYTHCGWDVRPAAPDVSAFKITQFGGRRRASRRSRSLTRASRRSRSLTRASRRFRQQRGGGCGCMAMPPMQTQRGGGSGNGGYHTMLTNDLGKFHGGYVQAACPPAPRETQIGGAAVDDIGLVSYKSGYGFGPASVYSTASAHYLDKLPYDRTVLTGGNRKGSRKGRKGSRKGRKGSRKH